MALTIENIEYTDLCSKFIYGKNILEYSENILEAINHFMEETPEIDWSVYNPDNFYVNILQSNERKEVAEIYNLDETSENFLEELSDKVSYVFGYDSDTISQNPLVVYIE